jgi:hypothetical protein
MKVSFFILACIGFLAASAVAGVSVPKLPWITAGQQTCMENKAQSSTEVAAQIGNCVKISTEGSGQMHNCIVMLPLLKPCFKMPPM